VQDNQTSYKDVDKNSIDEILEKLRKIKDTIKLYSDTDLSEADTRCKIIDDIFIDVLGWKEGNIKRESSYRDKDDKTQYIDYVFESNKNKFIVEAKKNGVYFNTVTSVKKLKLNGVLSRDNNTKKALDQAYNYCINKRIDVGCICNGKQIIVFNTNNQGSNRAAYVKYRKYRWGQALTY